MNYAWMNDALAWLSPVASQTNTFYVYHNKLLAFSGSTVAEYDTPFSLTKDVFGVSYPPAKLIDWAKVTEVSLAKTWNVKISGGSIKLPVIEHAYHPEAINVDGETVPASDVVTAVRALHGGVEKDIIGWWQCVHFDGDAAIAMPRGGTVFYRVGLPWSLSMPAEIQPDGAKMLIGLPLKPDAQAIFCDAIDIQKSDGSLYGQSYRTLTVVSGVGRWMTVLGKSDPISANTVTQRFYQGITHHMEIGPELVGVIRMLKSLQQVKSSAVHADLDFREGGLFVSGSGVDAIQVPVQYADNVSPNKTIRLQVTLLELDAKKPMHCGFSGPLKPFAIFLDDKDVFVWPMEIPK